MNMMGMNNNMNMNNNMMMNNNMNMNDYMPNRMMNPNMNMNMGLYNSPYSMGGNNIDRLKYLLQNIQTNLYNIMNQINEVEYLLNEIKNEKKDSKNISDYNNILNMQQLMFQQQQQQMLIQQMLFQQHQMNVNHGEINVIFRTSGSNNGCKVETVMISCKLTEKTSDIINRYREKSKNYKKNLKFIFNAKNLKLDLTAEENLLTNNCNVFVLETK